METIDISGAIGLAATGVLTLNFLLGMMLSTGYKRFTLWKKLPAWAKRIDINDVHNYTAYIAWGLIMTHILLIPLDPSSKFRWVNLFVPNGGAPHQPLMVNLGILSLYALVIVIITTQKVIKRKMGFRTWKNIHLVSYGTAVLFVIHGVAMDPLLKDRPIDWFDAEKMISELCGVVLIAASVMRYRYHISQRRVSKPSLSQI